MSVMLIVRISGKPGHGKALSELIQPVPPDNDVDGFAGMDVYVNTTKPDEVILLEKWSSVDAHKKFLAELEAQGGLDEMLSHADAVARTYFNEAAS